MAATYPAPPAGSDLVIYLTAAGFTATGMDSLLDDAALAGAAAFGQDTGRVWSAATQTRVYDYPRSESGIVLLDGELASLTSLSVNGTAKVRNTDFWLLPANLPPYTSIRLLPANLFLTGSSYGAVSVAGVWGNANIPADAWKAMLWLALGEVLPLLLSAGHRNGTGPLLEWSEAGASEKYADYQKTMVDYSQAAYDRTVKRYQRWIPG